MMSEHADGFRDDGRTLPRDAVAESFVDLTVSIVKLSEQVEQIAARQDSMILGVETMLGDFRSFLLTIQSEFQKLSDRHARR